MYILRGDCVFYCHAGKVYDLVSNYYDYPGVFKYIRSVRPTHSAGLLPCVRVHLRYLNMDLHYDCSIKCVENNSVEVMGINYECGDLEHLYGLWDLYSSGDRALVAYRLEFRMRSKVKQAIVNGIIKMHGDGISRRVFKNMAKILLVKCSYNNGN